MNACFSDGTSRIVKRKRAQVISFSVDRLHFIRLTFVQSHSRVYATSESGSPDFIRTFATAVFGMSSLRRSQCMRRKCRLHIFPGTNVPK